jgi:hypothetical protein
MHGVLCQLMVLRLRHTAIRRAAICETPHASRSAGRLRSDGGIFYYPSISDGPGVRGSVGAQLGGALDANEGRVQTSCLH